MALHFFIFTRHLGARCYQILFMKNVGELDIRAIIKCIDAYLDRTGKVECTPPEANAELAKAGILPDSETRKGLPLRRFLRGGLIPHAYKKGVYWYIPKSK